MSEKEAFRMFAVCSLLFLAALASAPARAAEWNVYNVSQLNTAVNDAGLGDIITVHPGTYDLTSSLWMDTRDVTLRGATGNPADVILWGGGMNNTAAVREAVQLAAPDITVKDLTIEGFYHHGIHFQPAGDRAVVDNVVTRNIGEQHMKGSKWNDDLVIRDSLLVQTEPRLNGLPDRPDDYVGGIDLHGARRAHIYGNTVIDIVGLGDAGDGGIFMWNESQDSVVERNVVIGTNKGIAMGNPSDQGVWQVQNTIVRNNFILRRPNQDVGLELCYTKDVKVYNNTIYSTAVTADNDWFRTIHVYDNAAHPTTNLEFRNNLIRGQILDNAAGDWAPSVLMATNNIIDTSGSVITADWFVDPDNLDLHLTENAALIFDLGVPLADVLEDFDGGPRPAYGGWDIGADEFGSPAGDANLDGAVNVQDLSILATNWGKDPAVWVEGNLNGQAPGGDTVVNVQDLSILATNWGFGTAGAVPEPGAVSILALGGLWLIRRRRD